MLSLLKRTVFYVSVITVLLLQTSLARSQSLLPFVQPLSGTAPATTKAALKHGAGTEQNANTIPAVGVPFGMTQWTPQTRSSETKCIPPYFYNDTMLTGFRGSHWISGSCTQDYGSFTLMPVTGHLTTDITRYAMPFKHSNEVATPTLYSIELPSAAVSVKMTATSRCGLMQFTMHKTDSLYILISPNSDRGKGFVSVNKATGEVWGYNPVYRIYQGSGTAAGFSGYFYMQFDNDITTSGVFAGSELLKGDSVSDKPNLGAYIGLKLKKGAVLSVRVGTSFSSIEGAKENLRVEIPDFSFTRLVSSTSRTWDTALGSIQVQSGDTKDKRIFYTAMYHALQHPRVFSDVSGNYPRFAGDYKLEKITKGSYYCDFSMWDTYRAQLPLLEILRPTLVNDFVRSLILKGEQGDWLPIFPCWNSYTAAMIGDHATAFIASAYTKGIRYYDVQQAYALMRKNAFEHPTLSEYRNGKGRRALSSYLQYGYIPTEDSVPDAFHKKEQVSRTLEYAFDDYALSVVAKGLGQSSDFVVLTRRSKNYKNIFDPSVGMVRGRNAAGGWYTPFLPDNKEPYITEGTPRQYTFYVPHDVDGLAELMGGRKALENALDSLFGKKEYWHGNEPGHQIPFMYNYTSSKWKTQQEVSKILAEEYSDGPGGLSGNDDAGQMSAWYVFASLGFYPVDPVGGEYQLCTPLFRRSTLKLENGRSFEVKCIGNSNARFIAKVELNNKTYLKTTISHRDIMNGGTLKIYLTDFPGKWLSK